MRLLRVRMAAPAALILTLACAASFVTPYDQVLDGRVTELHSKIETFLDSMELGAGGAEAAYRTNWHFYVECLDETQVLRRRANADGREDVARSLGAIAVAMEALRRSHEVAGTLARPAVQQLRPALREAFDAIYRRQSAIRRGL
jgi:hypothetical protein